MSVRAMARVWNGDDKDLPTQTPFLMLTTGVSCYHRMRGAMNWRDVGWLMVDELHNKVLMNLLLIAYFVGLKKQKDPRVEKVELILMTATQEGPVVNAVKKFLKLQDMLTTSVDVPPLGMRREPCDLWKEIGNPPEEWERMNVSERTCFTLKSMVEWIQNHWDESTVI